MVYYGLWLVFNCLAYFRFGFGYNGDIRRDMANLEGSDENPLNRN